MNRARLLALGIGFGLALPALASAQTAFTTRPINLRAGPDKQYPLVTAIPAGAPVEVAGCVNDWTWCDVTVGNDRGWAYASGLVYPYEGQRVSVYDNGANFGWPVVAYDPGVYWDSYYRGRPWYGRRTYWVGHPWVSHRTFVEHPGVIIRPGHGFVREEHRGERHIERRTEQRHVERREEHHAEQRQEHHAEQRQEHRAAESHSQHTSPQHAAPQKEHKH